MNKADVANCMTILSAADLLSRLTVPTLTEKFKISFRKTFMAAAVATIVVRSGNLANFTIVVLNINYFH